MRLNIQRIKVVVCRGLILLPASLFGGQVFAQSSNIIQLLKISDRARGGLEKGASWEISLKSVEEGNESERTFAVKAKGDNAFVEALAPSRNKGEVYVFNDRSMWFFKPTLKKPVVVSSREKLTGQAANGDIASTHYARDYVPTLETTVVEGDDKLYVILLKAKSKQVTYDQIRYWISEKTKLGVKAEFLTLQGKPFKLATFEYKNSIVQGGKKAPFVSQMTLVDSKFKDNRSVMVYTNPKAESHSDAIFNVNNVTR
ncbi:MAG: outer membrane lipoprotein-sorting protein [Bdellovibrionaceae bacterium]|nr:outer membrane lipoprotein-sorting protein [Pseudobdellovibrionaceae bacterium]